MTEENEKSATEDHMQALAEYINAYLNQINNSQLGFALIIFPFGTNENAEVNYISNGHREDMIQAFKDTIEQLENSKP